MVSKNHPRYDSLLLRDKIVDYHKKGIVADSGMIAHGRGETFDYLLGEKTNEHAKKAIQVSAAMLLLSDNPVISVNGNTVALVGKELVRLNDVLGSKLEINLFYRTSKRAKLISELLESFGASVVYGTDDDDLRYFDDLDSARSIASYNGIFNSDLVLVPLEDGDRAEVLVNNGIQIICVDLNPLSRTSIVSSVSITDNIVRVIPLLINEIKKLKLSSRDELKDLVNGFDNKKNLKDIVKNIQIRTIE